MLTVFGVRTAPSVTGELGPNASVPIYEANLVGNIQVSVCGWDGWEGLAEPVESDYVPLLTRYRAGEKVKLSPLVVHISLISKTDVDGLSLSLTLSPRMSLSWSREE